MPARNTIKEYVPNSYYHIYNRGVEKRKIFLDEQDYTVFLSLLKRYLSKESPKDSYGRDGTTFYTDIELQAYCLMPNHFHMLIFVNENPRAMTGLMRRVCTSYTVYFNKKHKRVGQLLQGRFKASRITSDPYLLHVSRYIHLNPKDYKNWPYSSVEYYTGNRQSEWVRPQRIRELFEEDTYDAFLADYEDYKAILEEIKYELADSKLEKPEIPRFTP